LAAIPAGSRILDAGAGELKYRPLCAHLDYVSQDFGVYDGRGDSIGFQTGHWDTSKVDILSDITQIPESDASFDAVMCIEVLEHVPGPVEALHELSRVLKPGGILVLTAPFCALTHLAPYMFETGFTPYFYEHWLDVLGFEIEAMEHNGNYFEYLAQEVRRLPEVGEQYAGMKPRLGERAAIAIMLELLGKLSGANEGSEALLCFGIHIQARKKPSKQEPGASAPIVPKMG
jgi:SAM-dependent methyltransferase